MEGASRVSIRVLVKDNYRVHADGGSIDGFASVDTATQYAKRRTRASVEELRHPGQTAESLRGDFLLFGETATVFAHGVEHYRASDDIDHFIAHPAQDDERDWMELSPPDTPVADAPPRPRA